MVMVTRTARWGRASLTSMQDFERESEQVRGMVWQPDEPELKSAELLLKPAEPARALRTLLRCRGFRRISERAWALARALTTPSAARATCLATCRAICLPTLSQALKRAV